MTAFDGGREDWERLSMSGALSIDRDTAARVRRARKIADWTVSAIFWLLMAAAVVAII